MQISFRAVVDHRIADRAWRLKAAAQDLAATKPARAD
jgi:hypothetical protein